MEEDCQGLDPDLDVEAQAWLTSGRKVTGVPSA